MPVGAARGRIRSAQVNPEQSPNHDRDQAWCHVVHLRVARFLPYSDDNDREQYEDKCESGDDSQDQHGKHQLSALLLMI